MDGVAAMSRRGGRIRWDAVCDCGESRERRVDARDGRVGCLEKHFIELESGFTSSPCLARLSVRLCTYSATLRILGGLSPSDFHPSTRTACTYLTHL